MFSRQEYVRRDPYFASYEAQKPIRLDEARLDAWALALGQQRGEDRSSFGPSFRPHRGELPDVDLSRAVPVGRPVRREPGLFLRLVFRLFRSGDRAGASESATGAVVEDHTALGESRLKAYVRLIEAEASGEKAAKSAPLRTAKHRRAA